MIMNTRPADRLAIAVAQLNPIVGDIAGNLEKARKTRAQAARDGADIVAFSELFIAGYPPEDLVLKPAFQAACRAAVEALARDTADGGPAVLMGTPWVEEGRLYNAYALLAGGEVEAIRYKVNLPNYGVFDEKRVFASGPVPGPVSFRGVRLGLPICEDTWTDWGDYENVVECRTARPIGATRRKSGSMSRWRASPRPRCRSSTLIKLAARMSSSSTAPRSRSTPIARSPFSFRRSRK
jgi:NAD+ synthase